MNKQIWLYLLDKRNTLIIFAISLIYFFLRYITFFKMDVRLFNDSASYLDPAKTPFFSSQLWMGFRPVTVPLIYHLAGANPNTIVWLQFTLSIIAWLSLALLLTYEIKSVWVKYITFVIVLVFSTNANIVIWDKSILSDSLAISFMVAFLAANLWMMRSQSLAAFGTVLITGILWTLTRETQAWLLPLLALVYLLAGLATRTPKRIAYFLLAILFLAVFMFNQVSSQSGQRWQMPLIHVYSERIFPYPEKVNFFARWGMPVNTQVLALAGTWNDQKQWILSQYPQLHDFYRWYLQSGQQTMLVFLLEHPKAALVDPLKDWGYLVYTDFVPAYAPSNFYNFLPGWLENAVYFKNQVLLLSCLLISSLFTLSNFSRKNVQIQWLLPLGALLLAIPLYYVSWHGDTGEIERHLLYAGVQIRLSLWIAFFYTMDLVAQNYRQMWRLLRDNQPVAPIIVIVGLVTVLLVTFADRIFHTDSSSFGASQWIGLVGGFILIGVGEALLLDRRRISGTRSSKNH
jgi:hypothetical protein